MRRMASLSLSHDDIPGMIIFDGRQAMKS